MFEKIIPFLRGEIYYKNTPLDEAIRFALVTGPGDNVEILGRTKDDRLTLPIKDISLLVAALREFKKTESLAIKLMRDFDKPSQTIEPLATCCGCADSENCSCASARLRRALKAGEYSLDTTALEALANDPSFWADLSRRQLAPESSVAPGFLCQCGFGCSK